MSDLNEVNLIGRLGRDPEIRQMQNGNRVCSLSVATGEKWTDKKTGEAKERTEWHRIVVFADGLIGVIDRYLKSGSRVFLRGELQTRKWQDQAGQDRYSTEIVLQGFRGQIIMLDGPGKGDAPKGDSSGSYGDTYGSRGEVDGPDDEIPF